MIFLVGWGCYKVTFRITEVGNSIHLIKCLYLRMIKWRCALPQKILTEGILAYAYIFMCFICRWCWRKVGHERWKHENNNDRRGGLPPPPPPPRNQSILMPEKKIEVIFVTPPPYGFINEILTPPPIWGKIYFMPPPKKKLPTPHPSQLINNDRPLSKK